MFRSKFSLLIFSILASLFLATGIGIYSYAAQEPSEKETRASALKAFNSGNFRDAYNGYQKLCLNPETHRVMVSTDLGKAVQSLQRLGRQKETDQLMEQTIEAHGANWRLLQAAAKLYIQMDHNGVLISGEFERGPHRGQAKFANAAKRDRVRALQLMTSAIELMQRDHNASEAGAFYFDLANQLLSYRGYYEAWRLQYLTEIAELPDYEEGYPQYFFGGGGGAQGAPVDEDGNPVFHAVAKSWTEAKSDGERWRWCLQQAVEYDATQLNKARNERAQFARNQFGVQTMAYNPWFGRGVNRSDDGDEDSSGTYELHTLKENETIAKLANGIKRFELPKDYNFVEIYKTIADEPRSGFGESALSQLANLFTDRRQFETAASYWKQNIETYGDRQNSKKNQLDQIIGNWGRFESTSTHKAGEEAELLYRFRNGGLVNLTAHQIKIDEMIADVKAHLKANPKRVDYQTINLGNIGYRLLQRDAEKYTGKLVASWSEELEPLKNHFDRRITLETPLKKAGVYMIQAKMADGNTSQVILWVNDTVIVRKQLSEKNLYYVADSETGKPIDRMNVEFFGYRSERVGKCLSLRLRSVQA